MPKDSTSNHGELMNRKYSMSGGNFSKEKKLSEYSGEGGASPSEDCVVLGCNTYGCLSSGKCEG